MIALKNSRRRYTTLGIPTAREILHARWMQKPETYYSDKAVNLEDNAPKVLNPRKLKTIQNEIASYYGGDAMHAYVEMIADLTLKTPEFGAPVFIQSLYSLEQNKWRYTPMIRENAENMFPASAHAPDFKDESDKAEKRRWLYTGFLKGSIGKLTVESRGKVKDFFNAGPKPE